MLFFLCAFLFLPVMLLYPSARSAHGNRRAAGAVGFCSRLDFYLPQIKPFEDCRPGGEAFCFFRVFSGLK
jgi:hypothetical protein